jgi:hypothetical protein
MFSKKMGRLDGEAEAGSSSGACVAERSLLAKLRQAHVRQWPAVVGALNALLAPYSFLEIGALSRVARLTK